MQIRVRISDPWIMICRSNLSFCRSLWAVFVKFANQNFLSVGVFVFRETTKFLFTLQAQQIAYILLQILLNCTLFSCIWIAFGPKLAMGGLQLSPIPSNCWNFSLNLCGSLLKRWFEPWRLKLKQWWDAVVKEKRGHFLYLLFCPEEIILKFVFYLNV